MESIRFQQTSLISVEYCKLIKVQFIVLIRRIPGKIPPLSSVIMGSPFISGVLMPLVIVWNIE
jgi:hypothetical protein